MISFTQPQSLQAAVDSVSARTPLGTALRTAEISRLPVEIRQRAFFSAAVEDTRLLESMKRDILTRLRLERRTLADGSQGTFQRRDQFLREMQQLAERYGLRPTDGTRGTLQDIGSFRRLGLIWDVQTKMAQGYSEWQMGQDPDVLDAVPALELVRKYDRRLKRDWNGLWRDAIQDLGDSTSAIITPNGRMMALKGDIIWTYISRFDQPWEPFDFNSGMGTRNLRRKLAEKHGLIKPGEKVKPVAEPFNSGLEASMRGISTPGKQKLKDYFGDVAEMDEKRDVIKWRGDKVDSLVKRAERRLAGETFEKKLKAVSFGKVDKALADRVRPIMEIDDFEFKPMEDDIYHILNKHGEGKEIHPDQRPITTDDFYYLLTSWRRPVVIEPGEKPRSIKMTYNFLGDLISVLWNRDPNQKMFNLNTMYSKI